MEGFGGNGYSPHLCGFIASIRAWDPNIGGYPIITGAASIIFKDFGKQGMANVSLVANYGTAQGENSHRGEC
ncbi:MAG: hypothetical protein DRN30_00645 [Thermoplasmata archaeon]|nr:MAG: hypothetical protein DRN30_00645 [Thermoplasmata archaeon]